MNIVLVNHYAGGPQWGMEFRPTYLAKEWIKNGHKVMIIGGSFSHLRTTQPTVQSRIQMENVDGIQYVWIKVNQYKGNGIERIISMVRFIFGLFFFMNRILKKFSPDLLIASSTYPMDNFAVRYHAKKLHAKFCYEVHDLWPLSPMELGGYTKNHPFIRLVQWAEDYAYREADFVISMLPKAKDYMISRGLIEKKFFYVPNGFSIEEWESSLPLPTDYQTQIKVIQNKHRFLVGYAGGHSISNSLESLVRASEFLDDSVGVLLIGDGMDKARLQTIAQLLKAKNVYFLAPILKKSIPTLLSYFDVLFIGAPRQSLYRFGISPNKMIDYMMAGKPIVQAIAAGNNMVEEYQCGIAVEPENPMSIANGIKKILTMSPEKASEMGWNGRSAALKYHNYRVLADQFIVAAQGS